MKIIKKIAKNSRRIAEKILYSFMVMMMLLQPVSAPGVLRALASDETTTETASAPASEEAEEESEEEVEETVEETVEEATEESAPAVEEEPIVETVVSVEEVVPVVEETTALPTETVDTQAIEITGEGQITPEAASIVAPENISSKDVWSKDGDKATTNDPVEKGVKYTAPQNEDVTVTFTKLPENPGTLSIEEIILTPEQVEMLGAISNEAYDITSTMENGTFEYDLTLPNFGEKEVQISYIEKSVDEMDNIDQSDIKLINENKIVVEDDRVEANGLNHFTIFFSEYIEGSSFNKALEIYNNSGANIDFVSNACKIAIYSNGAISSSLTINLTGTVANGEVYVITNSSADAIIKAEADQITSETNWFNGNDAVALICGSTTLDVIGQIGSNPGTEWGSGLTSTADNTLVRKLSIMQGDMNSSDVFDPSLEWDGYVTNSFSFLGSHTIDAPTLIAPTNNAVVRGIPSLTNSWNSFSGAVKYKYESYHDSAMTSPRWSGEFTTTSKTANNVADANFWWRVKAVDALGNESGWSDLWKVTVDNTAPTTPTISGFKNPNLSCGAFTNIKNITVDWSDSSDTNGVVGYNYYIDYPLAPGPGRGIWDTFFGSPASQYGGSLNKGIHHIKVQAKDEAGNVSSWSNICDITYDATVPTVDLVFPVVGSGATSFEAQFSEDVNESEAENPANYFLNNWPGAGGTGNLDGHAVISYDSISHIATITFTTSGWYASPEQEWGVQDIHDLAGNLQSVNPYTEYSTPMIAPATTDDIADSNWHNSVTVNLSCTDTDGSGCKTTYHTTDGSDPDTSSSTGNSFTLSVDGVYIIKYFSVDNAGNVESVKTAVNQIKIDTVAPTVVSVDSDDATYNLATSSPQRIEVTFSEDISTKPVIDVHSPVISGYYVDDCNDGDAKTFCFDYPINTGEELTHTIYISEATDLAGNVMTQDSAHTFDVDTIAPTVTFIDPTPSDGLITNNNDQTFHVSVDESVSSCTLNFNGNYIERQIANGLTAGSGFSYLISGDDYATNYSLPFSFLFYGHNYNNLSISTNGLMDFGSTYNASYPGSVSQLRSTIGIATLWNDLVTTVYARQEADNVRFRWTGTGWSTGGYLTNEAVLRSNGTVELDYGNVNLPYRNVTAGLSSGNGIDYVLSSVNGQSVISPVSYAYSPGATATYPMDLKLDGTYSVTVSGMNDGVTNYSVVCTDLAQNDGTSESRSVTIDTIAPTATISYSTTNWTNSDVTATLNPSESVTVTNNPGNTTYTFTDNGTFTFEFVDLAGNTGSATATVSNIDKTAPIVDAGTDKLVNAQFTQEATVDGSISAVASYAWSQVSGPGIIIFGTMDTEDTTISADIDGTYVIRLTVVDNAGNSAYDEFTLVWDKTLPEITLAIDPATNDGDNGWYVSNPEITLTATDDNGIEKIEYQLNSDLGTWITYTGPVTITDGTWQFYYRSIDKASNINSMGPKDVKVDTNDPDNVSNFEAEYRSDTTDVKLTWDADNSNIYKVYIYRGGSRSFSVNSGSRIAKNDDNDEDYTDDDDIELGETYYYKILTTDEAGNKSDVRIIKIVIPEDETSNAVSVDEGTETLPEGTVLGTETGDENEGDENKDDEEGVLGEQNQINGDNNSGNSKDDSFWSSIFDKWPWLLLVIIILGGGWYISRRKK